MQKWLESGKPLRNLDMNEDFRRFVDEQFLLTSKPVIYVANTDEAGINGNAYTKEVERIAKDENTEAIVLCAKLEEDLSDLGDEDRAMFMEDYGLTESGLDRLVKASYKLLGLISYLTAGEKETRAWTIVKGTKAPQAAGKSTATSNADSSAPKSSTIKPSSNAVRSTRQKNVEKCVARGRIM